jgi:hypothetical protein
MAMKYRGSSHRLLLAALLAVASACGTKSPTEPSSQPSNPQPPPPTVSFTVTVTSRPGALTAGGSSGSTITVQVTNTQTGAAAPDLTPVTLTTSLGGFNSPASPVSSVSLQLVKGQAQAVLYPGPSAGTAAVAAVALVTINGAQQSFQGATSVTINGVGTFFVNSVTPSTGDPAGGLSVTINGGGFLAPVSVLIGSSNAPVTKVSPNAITVITPASTTTVPVGSTLPVSVTVNNNLGGSSPGSITLNNGFTYVPGGGGVQQPQVFSVTPASGTNQGGTQVTLTGEGFVSPVQVLFGTGSSASSFNGIEATIQSVTANKIVCISPPAQGFGETNTNALVSLLVKNLTSGFSTIAPSAFQYGSKVMISSAGPTITQWNQQVKVTIFGQGFGNPVAVTLAGIAAQVLSTSGTEIEVLSGVPTLSGCQNVVGPITVTNINNGDTGSALTFTYVVNKPILTSITPATGLHSVSTPVTIFGSFFEPGGEEQVSVGNVVASVSPSSTMSELFVTIPPLIGNLPTASCTVNGQTGSMEIGMPEPITITDPLTSCSATYTGAFTYEPSAAEAQCTVTTPPQMAPVATFTDTVVGGPMHQVNFIDTSTNTPTSWTWNFGDGNTSAVQNPVHDYAAAGTYTVSLKACNAAGCGEVAEVVTVP